VIGGYTNGDSVDTVLDAENFNEKDYVAQIHRTSGNVPLALNWYNSFKVDLYFLCYCFCISLKDRLLVTSVWAMYAKLLN
jgi:cytochrome b involved in lipid metabolism